MTRLERRLLKLWLILTVAAAIRWFAGEIAFMLIFTGIGIPIVLLLEIVPTVWLYATTGLMIYLLLRRIPHKQPSRGISAGVAAASVMALGFAVPQLANREVERRAAAVMAGDMGTQPLVEPVGTVAILDDYDRARNHKCWDECQRLLFSGLSRNVLVGSIDALRSAGGRSTPLVRHSIVPFERGCDNSMLVAARATSQEWTGAPPPPLLWEKLAEFGARRHCFRSDRARDARADLYLVHTSNLSAASRGEGQGYFDLRFLPLDRLQRQEVFRRENGRLIPLMRRTELNFSRLAVPLRLTPPFTFTMFRPGHWTYESSEVLGRPPASDGMMGRWLKNDLRITGLGATPEVTVIGRRGTSVED